MSYKQAILGENPMDLTGKRNWVGNMLDYHICGNQIEESVCKWQGFPLKDLFR